MKNIEMTAYDMAMRFVGVTEIPGKAYSNQIMSMLRLDKQWPDGDEVPWCCAFVNYIAWLLRLPRSKELLARSWLKIGLPVALEHAVPGFDVVVLKRGGGDQPGPENTTAQGHVGWFAWLNSDQVYICGGNQNNQVCVDFYPTDRVLGVRRLRW